MLESERHACGPLAAHADSEERAQDQKDGEIRRERGQELDRGIKNDVDHERNAPPEPVAPLARDEVVEFSIGAIHVRVDAPAAQTVARPATTPRAVPAPPPRSALSRRALRRI